MLSLKNNDSDLQEVSIDVVFLSGAAQENLTCLNRMVKAITMKLPTNRTQVWIETPEFIRLWNVPSRFLIRSYNRSVFVQDGCLVFRKQNHSNYVFEQHYQIMIVCPKDRLSEVFKIIDDFRKEAKTHGIAVVTPRSEHVRRTGEEQKRSHVQRNKT